MAALLVARSSAMKRLKSATQIAVLEAMHQGWTLHTGVAHSWLSRWVGDDLETKKVRSGTAFTLKKKGYIEVAERKYPISTWKLVAP